MTAPGTAGPEFSRPLRAQDIGTQHKQRMIEAEAPERAALTERFGLVTLDRLTAALEMWREAGGIRVTGQVHASGAQPCIATAEPVPFLITEMVSLLFVDAAPEGDEIELADEDLDTEILAGDSIDLGEVAAQALALALDPYPRSTQPAPGVLSEEQARMAASPFAILKKP